MKDVYTSGVERLHCSLPAGGSSGTVGVLRLNNSSSNIPAAADSAAAAAAAEDDTVTWRDDPHVSQLVSYGYPPDHAMHQLQQAKGNLLLALYALQQQLLQGPAAAAATADGVDQAGVTFAAAAVTCDELLPQEWVDEVKVLSAIYGGDLDSSTSGALTLTLESEQVSAGCALWGGWGGGMNRKACTFGSSRSQPLTVKHACSQPLPAAAAAAVCRWMGISCCMFGALTSPPLTLPPPHC
jgi:hypothetical protein